MGRRPKPLTFGRLRFSAVKMSKEIVYFVHITDSHLGPTPDYTLREHVTLPAVKRLVELINSLPVRPDFVMHTGDVVTNPHPDSYALAAETFSQLNVPIYYATGNHDTSHDIHKYLAIGSREDVTDAHRPPY